MNGAESHPKSLSRRPEGPLNRRLASEAFGVTIGLGKYPLMQSPTLG